MDDWLHDLQRVGYDASQSTQIDHRLESQLYPGPIIEGRSRPHQ